LSIFTRLKKINQLIKQYGMTYVIKNLYQKFLNSHFHVAYKYIEHSFFNMENVQLNRLPTKQQYDIRSKKPLLKNS